LNAPLQRKRQVLDALPEKYLRRNLLIFWAILSKNNPNCAAGIAANSHKPETVHLRIMFSPPAVAGTEGAFDV
jgi:hypothetical protein